MTPLEREIADAFARVTFLPGSSHKRFALAMNRRARLRPEAPLSARQAVYLRKLAYRFRRQMPRRLVEAVEAMGAAE